MTGWHVDLAGDITPPMGFARRAPLQAVVSRREAGVRRIEVLACGHRLSVERSTAESARRRCVGCQNGAQAPS